MDVGNFTMSHTQMKIYEQWLLEEESVCFRDESIARVVGYFINLFPVLENFVWTQTQASNNVVA